jgi:hypothetical protein
MVVGQAPCAGRAPCADRTLRFAGAVCMFVPAAESGVAFGAVAGAGLEFADRQSKAILGRFDIRG